MDLDENSAIATVYLEIKQGAYSHTQVEDVEPLEIGALLGNIGGFWGKLVDPGYCRHLYLWITLFSFLA